MTRSPAAIASFAAGFRLPFEAARMLLRERRLRGLASVPALLSLLAVSAAFACVIAYAGELHGWATAWMPELAAGRWYEWLWVAPAKLGLAAVGAALFLAFAGACLAIAYLLASLLASPFHDALAARVERLVTGAVRDDTESGALGVFREGARAMREEARRIAFFVAVVGSLAALGLLVPGAQLLTGPAILAFTLFFLPLDYASYTLDRRRVSFREKRRWLGQHKPAVLGFGAAAFVTGLVPLVNLFAMPVLVVGGTLLALRHPPRRVGGR
ncbi:MAG: EI24 domain-containing protein [Myxococcota bacterium]